MELFRKIFDGSGGSTFSPTEELYSGSTTYIGLAYKLFMDLPKEYVESINFGGIVGITTGLKTIRAVLNL